MLGQDGPLAPALALLERRPDPSNGHRAAEDRAALYLVRSTLMTLDDANRSGNYSVLRSLAAPSFQTHNSVDRLSELFATHRARALDLSVAAVDAPSWTSPPAIGPDRLLRLVGHYPAPGARIRFALAFEPSAGSWRLYEIIVGTEPESGSPLVTSELVNRP
ncbi:MAG: hypothetical protein JSS20_00930 [Proteobacteria bacterium]|nr:hypothetical protein [Pseudomonadota bacterium]